MNKIIFRGFHASDDGSESVMVKGKFVKGSWLYGNLVKDELSEITAIVSYVNLTGDIKDLSEINILPVIPETVGQYINLDDKDGRRIFEGDAIEFDHPYGGYSTHTVIRDGYRFNLSDFGATYFDYPSEAFSEGTEYMKVVGTAFF